MSREHKPFDVSKELANLRHEKKNASLKKLPPSTTIQRRPLQHAPVASPFAGPNVQKVVYVSARTPLMSAVKRVKKHLNHIEKRAIQSIDATQKSHSRLRSELVEASDKLAKASEEILVKASGRAMEVALRVGEWFRVREDEMLCKVEVRTSNVAAIDDIVEIEKDSEDEAEAVGEAEKSTTIEETTLTGRETTLEILGHNDAQEATAGEAYGGKEGDEASHTVIGKPKRKRKRRKRETYDEDDLPEARIRWVKTVEVAISLRA